MRDIIVDAHQDIAWNYFNNGRSFTESALSRRRRETDPVFLSRYGRSMVGLPDNLMGRVAVVCATIFVSPKWTRLYPDEKVFYEDPQEAFRLGMQQVDYYHRLADDSEQITLVQTNADLDAVLATWEDDRDYSNHRMGLIMLMEGADPIIEPAQIEEWYARGLRIIGPAWTQTRYSGGTKAIGPLTDLGRELLEIMASYNMILDLSHMAPEAALEALDRYEGPLFASHANPLRFRPDRPDRNLSDDMIMRIAERDGVVGIIPYNLFLVPSWVRGDRKDAATMDTVIAAIDHVCQLAGSARHAGIGSDFDGGFGAGEAPAGFETSTDLLTIGSALAERGYSDTDITAILSGNSLRVLRAGLPN